MPPAGLEREPISATELERPALARAESLFTRLDRDPHASCPRLVGPNGEEIELPAPLFRVLRLTVGHLLRGDSVAIAPVHKELTTQEAAELLNVSRPYLVQLLEEEKIPFTKTGAHRRVRLGDLLAYKRVRDAQREQAFGELARLSQELGLHDDRDEE